MVEKSNAFHKNFVTLSFFVSNLFNQSLFNRAQIFFYFLHKTNGRNRQDENSPPPLPAPRLRPNQRPAVRIPDRDRPGKVQSGHEGAHGLPVQGRCV